MRAPLIVVQPSHEVVDMYCRKCPYVNPIPKCIHVLHSFLKFEGCVYGGHLSAVLLPEKKFVQVPARKAYQPYGYVFVLDWIFEE